MMLRMGCQVLAEEPWSICFWLHAGAGVTPATRKCIADLRRQFGRAFDERVSFDAPDVNLEDGFFS